MLLAWMTAPTALSAHCLSAFSHDVPRAPKVRLSLLGVKRGTCAPPLSGRWVSYQTQLASLRDTYPERPPRDWVDILKLVVIIPISSIVAAL